jgi:hypothetical protein
VKQFRLKRIHVLAAGLVVSAAVAMLFFTMFIKPLQKSIKTTKTQTAAEQEVASQRASWEKQLEAAKAEERRVNARFERIMDTRMPKLQPFETKDNLAGEFFFWDFPRQEARVVDEWFRNSGAQVSGYSFPAWPTNLPDLSMKVLPPLNWNLTVTVKDFPAFQKWLLKLPHAPRFITMNGPIAIPGPRNPGDQLTVSVPVTLYEWTPAAAATAPAPAVAADTSGGMGGGMGGGGMRGGGGGMRGGGGGGMRGGGGGGGMRGGGGGGMRGGGGGGMRGGGGGGGMRGGGGG